MYHNKANNNAKYDREGEKWYKKRRGKIPSMLRNQVFQHLKLIVQLPHFSHS